MDLGDRDLYELIGAEKAWTTAEIKKAYRKKALSCHPDKNPDNPRAAELFHELTHALEILTDTAARAAYDKIRDARHQAKLRVKELDSKRKKLKEELEAREAAYKTTSTGVYRTKTDEEKFQAEVERLRKEGSRQVEEEVRLVTERIQEELHSTCKSQGDNNGPYRIKIKWKTQKGKPNVCQYDYNTLYRIFSKYGNIAALVISPGGKGRALLEFENKNDAALAASTEIGFKDEPLTLEKLWQDVKVPSSSKWERFSEPQDRSSSASSKTEPKSEVIPGQLSDAEFEAQVLKNLRCAEERKRTSAMSSTSEGT